MSDNVPNSLVDMVALRAELQAEIAGLARSMASLMADPQARPLETRPATLGRRLAQVTAVNAGPPLTADVLLNGETIPGVSPQSTYRPQVNDLVWLEFLGADPHISPPLTTDANRKWNTLTLTTGWSVFTGTGWGMVPAYWRDAQGVVHLRGSAGGGLHNSTITTLPLGFRPPATVGFPVYCQDAAGAAYGVVAVFSTGAVLYQGPSPNVQVALDVVRFRVD